MLEMLGERESPHKVVCLRGVIKMSGWKSDEPQCL